ncbi:MAG: hypothetical protein Fur0032_20650 [Terrimicrobiaceae bacterium]
MKSVPLSWKCPLVALLFAAFFPAIRSASGNVAVNVENDWGSGVQVEVNVTNTTLKTATDWRVEIPFPGQITSIWNASIASSRSGVFVIRPAAWNRSLKPGEKTSFGFVGSPGSYTPTGAQWFPGPGPDPAPTPAPTPVPTPGGNESVVTIGSAEIRYRVTQDWGNGFQSEIRILNTGSTALNGWILSFDLGAQIGSAWDARVEAQAGNTKRASGLSYNTNIAPGGSVVFGFVASPGGLKSRAGNWHFSASSMTPNPIPNPTPVPPIGGYESMPSVEQRKIVGYYPNWGIYQKQFLVTQIRGDRINVINYAFLMALDREMPTAWNTIVSTYRGWRYSDYYPAIQQPIGPQLRAGVALFDEYADVGASNPTEALTMNPPFRESSNFAQLRDLKARYPKLRTMISLGGWTLSSPFFSISRDAGKRADLARSAVYVMKRYGFDGIDIDWEYPGGGGLDQAAMADPSGDSQNFLLLLQAMRDELNRQGALDGRKYYLSIAAPGGDDKISRFDPAAVANIVDWINVMTYDFAGGWDSSTGLQSGMRAVDPNPARANWSVEGAVSLYLNGMNGRPGVSPEKIILGIPFYGRGWDQVPPGPSGNGLFQSGREAASPEGGGEFGYKALLKQGDLRVESGNVVAGNEFTRHWNPTAQGPFLYSPTRRRFITYEDPTSLAIKADYANQLGLGGVMIWELSHDTATGPASLLDTIYQRMKVP